MKKKLLRSLVGVLLVAGIISAYGMLRLRSVPTAALRCLRAPQQMTLYSLEPIRRVRPQQPGEKFFRRYLILGETAITSPGSQQAVTHTIEHAVIRSIGMRTMCFDPRHLVRVSDSSGTYDFLICFSCSAMVVYTGDQQIADVSIFGFQAPLDALLTSARVPLASR